MYLNTNDLSEIKEIFLNINAWLNFAEIKHSAAIVLDIAIVSAMLSLEERSILVVLSCICLITSAIISLIAIYPNIKNCGGIKKKKNLVFYRDIALTEKEEYAQMFEDRKSDLMMDYIEEIIINSRITMKKYKKLKFSILCIILGIVLFCVQIIYLWFN